MQISEHVHALRIPFQLAVNGRRRLDRFVYAYLVTGRRLYLIDAGVAGSVSRIFDYTRSLGRRPAEIAHLFLTHSHPDHMGGARTIQETTGCRVSAHAAEQPWIEDVERQARERPILNFHELVSGSVKLDETLQGGQHRPLEPGLTLEVIHTPGHSRGSVCLRLQEEGLLFSGDAVPRPGAVPIYEDVAASAASIQRLTGVQGVSQLLASWDGPRPGDQIGTILAEGIETLKRIHAVVREEHAAGPAEGPEALAARALMRLGLPENALIPIVIRSFQGHLQALDHPDLL